MFIQWVKTSIEKVSVWSVHPYAPRYLALISFIDASIFPISPILLLIPMSLAQPKKAYYYSAIVIGSSLVGGVLGYGLGYHFFHGFLQRAFEWMGTLHYYHSAISWCNEWGFWAIIMGCFTPFIPYKFFTISSGVLQLDFLSFLLASMVGRTLRFMAIASLVVWGGSRVQRRFSKLPKRSSRQ